MTIDLAILKDRLRECGIRRFQDHENRVVFGVREGRHQVGLVVSLQEEGSYLVFRTVGLAKRALQKPENQEALSALSGINFEPQCVKVSHDPDDDEIVVEADVPLNGHDTLTKEQVAILLTMVVKTAVEVLEALEAAPESRGPSERRPPDKPTPGPSSIAPPAAPTPSSGGAPVRGGVNPVMLILALGVLLLGVAAIGGVLVLLIK